MKIKTILNLILLALIGFIPAVHSNIIKNVCIPKINDIFNHLENLPKDEKTIAAFDMDDTLVTRAYNEENKIVETQKEGDKTANAVKELQDRNIETMILTARLQGAGLSIDEGCRPLDRDKTREILGLEPYSDLGSQEEIAVKRKDAIIKYADEMDMFFPRWQEYNPLKISELQSLHIPNNTGNCMLTINNIVFAGGKKPVWKGKAMTVLIDKDMLKSSPNNILFIDDDKENIEEFNNSFKDRPENVYLFHYPKDGICP
jgi:hypothetical protein